MAGQSTSDRAETVVAVERAFAILHAISSARESVGVSAIGRQTHLAKSTVSRLLNTLDRLGMVERVGDDGRYRLGSGLAVFTPGVGVSLIELARPHLRELVADLREDAGLAVTDGFDVLYVDQVGGPEPVQVRDWTGSRHPPHTVAAGYVLMRQWPQTKLLDFLSKPLASLTPDTDTNPKSVQHRLANWSGYVWTLKEFASDVHGVAAPVRGPDGAIVAAVNLYGPSYRFPGDRSPDEIGELLVTAGESISRHLSLLYH